MKFTIFVFIIGFLSFGDAKGESCVSQPKKALSVHHPLGDFYIMRQELQLEGEVWKDITGYEGLYQASNLGRIKSLGRLVNAGIRNNKTVTTKGRVLKPSPNQKGYLHIGICVNNKPHTIAVHRLVAKTWVSNSGNKPSVNHINGIKCDNRVENLEWVTYSEQQMHSFHVLKRTVLKGKNHYSARKVYQYDNDLNFIAEYDTAVDAAKAIGAKACAIGQSCRTEKSRHRDCHWRFYKI